MIRMQPAGDHPVAHIAHAPPLDHPAGPLTLAVPIQQQRHHHLRVERRPAMAVGQIAAPEPAQVQRGHHIEHDEHQIVPGQPLAHVHRQQQRLITLREKEILRHTQDPRHRGLPNAGAPFVRQADPCSPVHSSPCRW
jgi:hypothetical protein